MLGSRKSPPFSCFSGPRFCLTYTVPAAQLGHIVKTRQKRDTCAGNSLTNFECEVQVTGNGSEYEFAETSMKKIVKSPWANLCFGGFLTFGSQDRAFV